VGLKRKPAAIIGYSGLLADPPSAPFADAPPVLLVHGDADPMIPPEYLFASATALGRAGVSVQWHLSPDTPHAIDPTGLALGGAFLTQAFRGQLKPKNAEISCPVS
jgi:phospholipase/carboxylesterase